MAMEPSMREMLKTIPKVDQVLAWSPVRQLVAAYPRPEVLVAVRSVLSRLRESLIDGTEGALPDQTAISGMVAEAVRQKNESSLRRVINGVGVVVHTNLGRSPLAVGAEEAIHAVASGYSNLEYSLENGERGTRQVHVEGLLTELTGAESALVVNNNAAAVILALTALASGRDVVVSRGELVEIGGSFRIPDIMRQSGARLVEVGTTNRTHPHDYGKAICDSTGLLLKVHTSNYAITGFTREVTVAELAMIGKESGIPVMLDAGSGCLIDLSPHGITGEPTVRHSLASGADLVTFSGDKLLGGPQAGIIVGKKILIDMLASHPLLRAFRADKFSLAALEATLRLYRDERQALKQIPVLRMLTETAGQLARKADRVTRTLRRTLPPSISIVRHKGESSAGGGAFPLLRLPTVLLEVCSAGHSPQDIERGLRRATTPVVGRIQHDHYLLDVRTLMEDDIPCLAQAMAELPSLLPERNQ